MLTAMTESIKCVGFQQSARIEEGCQTPVKTLEIKSGTCCDFASLMMEAVRSLALAACASSAATPNRFLP
jgi:transglutaminase-like putative cysteine protease